MFQFEQFTTGLSTKPTGLVVQLARHGSLKNCSLDWVVGSNPTWATIVIPPPPCPAPNGAFWGVGGPLSLRHSKVEYLPFKETSEGSSPSGETIHRCL